MIILKHELIHKFNKIRWILKTRNHSYNHATICADYQNFSSTFNDRAKRKYISKKKITR